MNNLTDFINLISAIILLVTAIIQAKTPNVRKKGESP